MPHALLAPGPAGQEGGVGVGRQTSVGPGLERVAVLAAGGRGVIRD